MKGKEKRNITVLVVDDSPESIELIRRNLESAGYVVYAAERVDSALSMLESLDFDLVITDLKMPGESGFTLVRHVSENLKGTGILVITGFPSIEGAIESIRIGAEEYLVKSFTDKELFAAVERVLSRSRRHKRSLPAPSFDRDFGMIGESEAMHKIFHAINKVRTTDATVLITGESGTGKELVARAIHYGSRTGKAAFVPVNCGGIPDTLLESELFGHVKGAFTGAIETRAGFFQTAERGTIFLDEISNTSLAMQAKLLRVLQDKEFYMVGSKKAQRANVRVVAATNVDLVQLVKQGLFREDLYYRLNILSIELPPLRVRGDDIFLLVNFFLARYARELGKDQMRFTRKALDALRSYAWPGNVRELQNIIHRLVIMADDPEINVADLPEVFRFSASPAKRLDRRLEDVERDYILDMYAANKGNLSRTAEKLGIDRKTLRERMKRYGNR